MIRLDRFISGQIPGISRSEAVRLCKSGAVTVDGAAARSPSAKIDPQTAVVTVNGEKICYKEHVYIMLNKPAGVVCATRDGLSQTVLELLPEDLRRQGLFPAGRLDKDTEGFVLITDDGALAHRMLSPKSHVQKLYVACLGHELCRDAEKVFEEGVVLEDGTKCLPAGIKRLDGGLKCLVTLHEGMYHQIKRMFEALGNEVTGLERVKIGGVWLDKSLVRGESRELTKDEVSRLVLNE